MDVSRPPAIADPSGLMAPGNWSVADAQRPMKGGMGLTEVVCNMTAEEWLDAEQGRQHTLRSPL